MNRQKGFTLIELLVSISIIGILVTLVMTNLSGLQQRGRDAQRKNALQSIATGLELYYTDHNQYPASLPAAGSALTNGAGTKTYIKSMPTDPRPTTNRFVYCVNNAGTPTRFNLYAELENNNDSDRYCKTASWSATSCDAQTSNCSLLNNGSYSGAFADVDYTISEP